MSITIGDKLTFSSGLVQNATTLTASTTLDDTYYIVRVEGAGITITLPSGAAKVNGRTYFIHNSDASNNVTIARNGENINGNASDYTLTAGSSITIYYNSTATTGWFII